MCYTSAINGRTVKPVIVTPGEADGGRAGRRDSVMAGPMGGIGPRVICGIVGLVIGNLLGIGVGWALGAIL